MKQSEKHRLVAGRHPVKQGLKQSVGSKVTALAKVAGRHPVKQGLKQSVGSKVTALAKVAGRHPVKQGLKHFMHVWILDDKYRRRAASSKTRIETLILTYPTSARNVSQGGIH